MEQPGHCTNEDGPTTERITQLESEIETMRAEMNRLKAVARNDADSIKDEQKGPSHFLKSLEEIEEQCVALNYLLERRLTGSACHAKTDRDADHLPNTSPQNDIIVASNDVSPQTPSPRRTNLFAFGAAWKKRDSGEKSNELEIMVRERDKKIEGLEAVIYSNISIIYKMKDAIKLIGEERTGNGQLPMAMTTSAENIAKLKEVLAKHINKESSSLSSNIEAETNASKAITKGEDTAQIERLKAELTSLQMTLSDMETRSSSQEDEIENLRAAMVKLEFKYDEERMAKEDLIIKLGCRDKTISNLEKEVETTQKMLEDLKTSNSFQEDEIEMLKVEIARLMVRSDLQEEETRHEIEEMKTNMELSQIESSIHGAIS